MTAVIPVVTPAPVPAAAPPIPKPEELISPEQHLTGVFTAYTQLQRVEQTYTLFHNLVTETGAPPLMEAPSGATNLEGEQIILTIDLAAPFKRSPDDAVRKQQLQAAFGESSNHYAKEYLAVARQLALHATNAWNLVSGAAAPPISVPDPAQTFTQLMQYLSTLMPTYYEKWKVLKAAQDSLLDGAAVATVGGVEIDLNELLAAAQVSDASRQALMSQVLGSRITQLQEDLEPCLREIMVTVTTAMHLAGGKTE